MITLSNATKERVRLARESGVGMLDMFLIYRKTCNQIAICIRDGNEVVGQVRVHLHHRTPQARCREARDVVVAAAESGKCRDLAAFQRFLSDLRAEVHAKNLLDGTEKPTAKEKAEMEARKRNAAMNGAKKKVAQVLARTQPDMQKVREFLYGKC